MSHAWLQHYPEIVKPTIELSEGTHIASVIEDTCQKYSSKIALTCMGADLTFRQFDRLANDFASYLQNEIGLRKGDRFAIMLPNVIQFPIALYAATKIGVICVNTNPLYTAREMKHQFHDSGSKALIILDMFLDKLEEILKETDIQTVIVTSIGDQLPAWKGALVNTVLRLKGQIPKHNLTVVPFKEALRLGSGKGHTKPQIKLEDIAVLQYTGGTTGLSKGAMLTHRNVVANMMQIQEWSKPYVAKGDETILTALPLYHIFALTVNFLAFLNLGGRMILLPKPVPIENTAKIFAKYRITVMTGVNTLYNALNNCPQFRTLAPKTLKVALAGGTALQSAVASEFQRITGTRVLEGFGLTEASPVTHCNPMHIDCPSNSIGLPLPSTDARIVDDNGKDVPLGEPGELIVKGPQVMLGYWNREDETANSIRDGWLYTGDVAKMDERGFFYIVDRKKDMVLVSGFNVYPNEIEEVLAMHPKVMEAAVIGIPDDTSGEAVKAFVVKKDDTLTEAELREWCEKNLTGYKRPRHYSFEKELPKTNVGKILRRKLRTGT
ncbi:MAG TPA: AMP-binding protein [Oligoflexus sp.]|uniref:AMP-binding protein n=1 Tax=Oligoflexus sp. TaxID=1971216 RepID=UPI002D559ED4|nr:AMP-binding protein [Oligoflexus sp.]HYX33569.1 AMP-binding protein [Oligoflexus sp.]